MRNDKTKTTDDVCVRAARAKLHPICKLGANCKICSSHKMRKQKEGKTRGFPLNDFLKTGRSGPKSERSVTGPSGTERAGHARAVGRFLWA